MAKVTQADINAVQRLIDDPNALPQQVASRRRILASLQERFAEEQIPSQEEALLQQNIEAFAPGGAFGEGQKAIIDESQRIARSAAFSRLVSSGMANLTGSFDIQAARGRALSIGRVEDERISRETGARGDLANLIAGVSTQERGISAGAATQRRSISASADTARRLFDERKEALRVATTFRPPPVPTVPTGVHRSLGFAARNPGTPFSAIDRMRALQGRARILGTIGPKIQ